MAVSEALAAMASEVESLALSLAFSSGTAGAALAASVAVSAEELVPASFRTKSTMIMVVTCLCRLSPLRVRLHAQLPRVSQQCLDRTSIL